jgi:hypothetical protein
MKRKLVAAMLSLSMVAATASPVFAASTVTNSTASISSLTIEKTQADGDTTADMEVNASVASSYTVTIPKSITLAGVKGGESTGTYYIQVTGDIAGDEQITVVPTGTDTGADNKFLMKQANKTSIEATITQPISTWISDQADGLAVDGSAEGIKATSVSKGVKLEGNQVKAKLTAGTWKGNITFQITNSATRS